MSERTSSKRAEPKRPQDPVSRFIAERVAREPNLTGQSKEFRRVQEPLWSFLNKYYFRLEVDGWDRIPDEPSLLIGIHSGGSLTMDAWTLIEAWESHFQGERILHGTAHDVLMAAPGLGDYFRAVGVIPASRKGVSAALEARHDVIVWPGGEKDAMRHWRKRDVAVLGGRKGFVRQAMRSGVPIVPVATIGGHDTVFVLSEGKFIAKYTGLGKRLRGANIPVVAGFPIPVAIEILPAHIPLPAKIRTEFLDPIEVDHDPERIADQAYVDKIYTEVEQSIQAGMDQLAKKRKFPIFG